MNASIEATGSAIVSLHCGRPRAGLFVCLRPGLQFAQEAAWRENHRSVPNRKRLLATSRQGSRMRHRSSHLHFLTAQGAALATAFGLAIS